MRRKTLAAALGAVLCLGLLVGCSSADGSDGAAVNAPDNAETGSVAASEGGAERTEGLVIATPFYSVVVPEELSEAVEWEHEAKEYSMAANASWENDDAMWLGHLTSVSVGGEAPDVTFFIVASRLNDEGEYVAAQGAFSIVKAGEVVVGDQTWAVSVCKGLNPDDPSDSSGEIRTAVEEYASWVQVGFDPSRVTDEAIMDGFLGSYCGKEWTAQR